MRTSRSGGPGGQHVNKTETKVSLELELSALPWPEADLARVRQRLSSRITNDDRLVVHAETYRQQARNLDAARRRLAELLRGALYVPKRRRPTKPSKGAVRRRLDAKRRQSDKKRSRSKPDY